MLATPPGYRPMHFEAAVEAKKHIFCEKPFGTDPVGVRRFMAAARKSEELKLTVVTGAQRRFQRPYVETVEKIQNGAIGDIVATYAYWVGTPVIQVKARDPKWSDVEWQHRNWYSFVWICGDQIVEQHLHNIDVSNWVMGMHPVKVVASGGAAWRPREEMYGNIYDHIDADFVYPNGVHMSSHCRQYRRQPGTYMNVSELVVGHEGAQQLPRLGQGRERSLRAGAHRDGEQHSRQRPVHQSRDGGRGEHDDLHHGPRVRVFGPRDHLERDHEVPAGSDAEGPERQREDSGAAASGSGRVPVRVDGHGSSSEGEGFTGHIRGE